MNEADTCRTYIVPKLKSAGWEDETITEQLVLTPGRIVPIGDRHTRKEGLRLYRVSSTGEGQRAAGVAVRERGGVAPALWADVDALRVG